MGVDRPVSASSLNDKRAMSLDLLSCPRLEPGPTQDRSPEGCRARRTR